MSDFSPKTYHIKTYGCQANMADSNFMAGVLEALGFEVSDNPMQSSIYLINTCSVRQKSEDKAYGLGKELKQHLEAGGQKPFIIMAGCMVGSVTGERQRYDFEELQKKTPWVDEYINPSQLGQLPLLLAKNKILDEWAISKISSDEVLTKPETNTQAFVNISYGCDNFCTFCVVPYARGKEVSRPKEDIVKEVKHHIMRGVTQFTLCGQNVNSWGLDTSTKFEIRTGDEHKLPFAELLREIHSIPEVEKIDFLSSNPFDFTQDLIEALSLPKISNYLHMAVQSGDNEMLKKMNRRHTVEDFVNLVEKIRKTKPNLELGTDIIVGFPGETEEQFQNTCKLFEQVLFRVAFISIYSPRKGTPAEKFYKDDISLSEKKRRHAHLTKVWRDTLKK
jgi:tRNA-2-methylthio-N6-dimethylallyladenosine synthase